MQKYVWVIEDGTYSDYHVVGIYSSKENAELANNLCSGEIRRFDLDPMMNEINSGMSRYLVIMYKDGNSEKVQESDLLFDFENKEEFYFPKSNENRSLRAYVWAKDEEHALKIADERRIRMLTSGEWE